MIAFEKVRDAALARLAVDADDRFVGTTDVCGIDGEVGNLPQQVAARLGLALRGEALLDGILMRARECSEDQLARVGVPRMHRQIGAVFGDADDRTYV